MQNVCVCVGGEGVGGMVFQDIKSTPTAGGLLGDGPQDVGPVLLLSVHKAPWAQLAPLAGEAWFCHWFWLWPPRGAPLCFPRCHRCCGREQMRRGLEEEGG